MKLVVLYCHFKKFFQDLASKTESLKNKLAEFEAENARMKDILARQDKELLLTG